MDRIEVTSLLKLDRTFYARPGIDVSKSLLGAIMCRRIGGIVRRARIIETEAYLGPKDLASHSSKGRTLRTEVMFGEAGHAYVYFIYGMHYMFNIVAGNTGEAHAILIRAAQPLDEWQIDLTGPAKFARGFEITRDDNSMDLTSGEISLFADPAYRPKIIRTRRIGIDYARHWKNRLLRFIDVSNPASAKLWR